MLVVYFTTFFAPVLKRERGYWFSLSLLNNLEVIMEKGFGAQQVINVRKTHGAAGDR